MNLQQSESAKKLPLLPMKDVVLFPLVVLPIFVSRDKSIKSLNACKDFNDGEHVLITVQKNHATEDPIAEDLYDVGVIAKIIQIINLPNNNVKTLVQALGRVKLSNIETNDIFVADYEPLPDEILNEEDSKELVAFTYDLISAFTGFAKNNKKATTEIINIIHQNEDNAFYVSSLIASCSVGRIEEKQDILATLNPLDRTEKIYRMIIREHLHVETDQAVQQRVKKQIERNQREYYLHEQIKAIQHELENNDLKSEFAELENKIKRLKLSKDAKDKATSELKKLKMMNQMSAESSVVRNYLETLLGMPWGKKTLSDIDIKKATYVLDRDHHGLLKVKERVVEYLSVLKRSKKIKSPILCFIGPPGVGKTSLVKSIAEAMGRKYTKFALGGLRDEAEVRGHRKTYLGSMPGKVINLIKKSKVDNPVMLLDEIDKMSADFRGDPASALLEVLDPEQNAHFSDHYLEVEYDLSDVVFIATANSYDLPVALLDRLEIIDISGYIEDEKLEIAKNHLIPKQLKAHNMKESELTIPQETALHLIRYYTKESGVRSLDRQIGAIARKALTKILKDKTIKGISVSPDDVEEYLGVKKYRYGMTEAENQIGIATGLAYTSVGGDLLTIEATSFPGDGKLKYTGKLGEVMRESAEAAYSCFLSRSLQLGVKKEDYKTLDVHLHVPEGAVPKDGPSAGITIYTTLVSLLTKRAVKKDVAMTGEITLRGKVLPIGGLKEKLLAASRGGIKTVIIPIDNTKDIKDIPIEITSMLKIIPVSDIDEVLDIALVK